VAILQRATQDRFLMTRDELEDRMAVLLGGRAAEHVFFIISRPAPPTTWRKPPISPATWC
jgi:hypothetical protein